MQDRGIRLVVSYDGTDFAGWQVQPAQRTVQAELERAAQQVAGHPVRVRAAGRTDAGVHALAQVAAFDTGRDLPMRNWVLALNSSLPLDVAVRSATPCPPGYDPRYEALDKTYRYLLHLGVVRHPLLRNRVWHLGKLVAREFQEPDSLEGAVHKLDIWAMRRAAQLFVGTHDFRSFRASDDQHDHTVRTISRVLLAEDFWQSPDLLAIEVTGNAFLKHMVRIMVGTLVDVGRGRTRQEQILALLGTGGKRQQAGETAPARGLTLVSVTLKPDPDTAAESTGRGRGEMLS